MGVDATDFQPVRSGIAIASGSGVVVNQINDFTYHVTVGNIQAFGSLGLNLIDNGKVKDLAGNVYTSRKDVAGFAKASAHK